MVSNDASKKELYTTYLAKELKMSTKAMFQQLVEAGLIIRNGDDGNLRKPANLRAEYTNRLIIKDVLSGRNRLSLNLMITGENKVEI